MACLWRGITSKGRILEVGRNNQPPSVIGGGGFPSCVNGEKNNAFGYPIYPFTTNEVGYTAWCLDNDESIVNIESYNCHDPQPDSAYDCLNGGCIPAATYNTPGKYQSLAACKSGCAKDSPCTGECITPQQLAALQQAANGLQARISDECR